GEKFRPPKISGLPSPLTFHAHDLHVLSRRFSKGLETRLASPIKIPSETAGAAKGSHVSVAISVSVALAISIAVAKLTPVAAIGPCVLATRIGIVRFPAPGVFAGDL